MATDNTLAFKADLRKFSKLVGVDLATVRRKITFDLLRKIIFKTPVDQGRLRASWFTSDGSPSPEVAPEGLRSGAGAASQSMEANVTAKFTQPFESTYVTNNLPYVGKIEFDGHSSTKAPAGMVRVSLAEMEAELMSTLKRIR